MNTAQATPESSALREGGRGTCLASLLLSLALGIEERNEQEKEVNGTDSPESRLCLRCTQAVTKQTYSCAQPCSCKGDFQSLLPQQNLLPALLTTGVDPHSKRELTPASCPFTAMPIPRCAPTLNKHENIDINECTCIAVGGAETWTALPPRFLSRARALSSEGVAPCLCRLTENFETDFSPEPCIPSDKVWFC